MRTLLLINTQEELHHSTAYASRISSSGDEIHLLVIIPVSGNIPTKRNGQVLDDCTDFDLSQFYTEQSTYQGKLDDLMSAHPITSAEVLIGERQAILSDQVKSIDPDIILTATELSTEAGDFFRNTHASEIRKSIHLPVLTYKCDRSSDEIKQIAIISDFAHDADADMELVKHIAEKSAAQITLYGFVNHEEEKPELEVRMDRFIASQGLANTNKVQVIAEDKEQGAQQLLMEYSIQLMVLCDIRRQGIKSLLLGNLEADILNHTAIPILAY